MTKVPLEIVVQPDEMECLVLLYVNCNLKDIIFLRNYTYIRSNSNYYYSRCDGTNAIIL